MSEARVELEDEIEMLSSVYPVPGLLIGKPQVVVVSGGLRGLFQRFFQ